jgi:HAD superfamily hydrolase (TIGR01549 family)
MEKITTILLDIGGTLIDDDPAIYAWYDHLKYLIADKTGREVTNDNFKGALKEAEKCYAPSFISYIIWQLVKPDKEMFTYLRGETDQFPFEKYFSLLPDAKDVLRQLHGKFKLGIMANQNEAVLRYLEKEGVLEYFESCRTSAGVGYSKPDLRYFLHVLEELGSTPQESLMVGDRQDNDIVPAKLLGMRAVRIRTGFHKNQEVRYPKEEADFTIEKIEQLLKIPPIAERIAIG